MAFECQERISSAIVKSKTDPSENRARPSINRIDTGRG
jgi:hypothetical protein